MWLTALSALALLAALPLLREMGRRPIIPRQKIPEGRMVPLTHGLTHIREDGPSDGPVIVLVHGLTTPSFVFDGLVPTLVDRGYRVLRYDHYGRGRSDRPRIAQDAAIFRQHLGEVLAACDVTGPVTLLGYSMGGAVVTAFAGHAPKRVSRLVLVAPAGLHQPLRGVSQGLARLPLIGAWLFHMLYPGRLRRGIKAERGLPGSVPDITEKQLEEARYRGYFRLIYRSLCDILAGPMPREHAKIARAEIPVTAIFGETDPLIPLSAADTLLEWNTHAGIVVVKGAGHGVPYTHSETVLDAL